MKNDIVIKVENLTKIYHLYDKPQDRLKEALNPFKKSYHHDFYAMNDVSFEIEKGETVGIIGQNGAGKSTLLKMITGVLTPSSGTISINGRIASLLELGAGFNPEYTGMENIYLQSTLMGFSHEEMESKVDEILQFADINDFINQSVKMYSSGMFARLAFAIAINVQPDILIVDEALAVGDMNFQAKCMTAMGRIQEKGTTILFVSHDINAVKSLCERGIYIKNGEMIAIGSASDIGDMYEREMRENTNKAHTKSTNALKTLDVKKQPIVESKSQDKIFKTSKEFDKKVTQFRHGTGEAKIAYVELLDMNDEILLEAEFNQEIKIKIYIECYSTVNISVNFQLYDDKKLNIAACSFMLAGKETISVNNGDKLIIVYTFKVPLQHNTYSIQAMIINPIVNDVDIVYIDVVPDAYIFKINKRPSSTLWSKVDLFPKLSIIDLSATEK